METLYKEHSDVDFPVGFSLYAVPSVCYMIATSGDETKSEEDKC